MEAIKHPMMTSSLFQTQFKGTTRQFSEAMLQSGMYRDHGFNTSVDRSRVTTATATLSNRVHLHRSYHYGNQVNNHDGNNLRLTTNKWKFTNEVYWKENKIKVMNVTQVGKISDMKY